MKNLFWLLCVFSLAGFVANVSAETDDKGQLAATVVIPDGLKLKQVQQSVLEAATNRGWTIRKKEDDQVVLFLENERWVANLTVVFDTKEAKIYSRSTRNGKPKLPENWIEFLKKDMVKSLNTKAHLQD